MKKKVLFIDRDGTLIAEPPVDFQVDSLEKLEYLPGVFRNMYRIANRGSYVLVLVSNQDGLGTDSFPEEDFAKPQNKFLEAFKNEGVEFDEVLIDPSFPEENSPNRKPGTGMIQHYMTGEYDLEQSFVIGDRMTDMELASNLGAKGIYMGSDGDDSEVVALKSDNWDEIADFVLAAQRSAKVNRDTNETKITVELSLDGRGKSDISTGLGFFDHMLEQISKHGGFDLEVKVSGDLEVDEHHTIEDTALVLGEAFLKALGDKRGLERYGFVLPMDDCLAQVALDFGGRPWLVWDAEFKRERVGDVPTEMFMHFFKSFSDASKSNLNIKAEGENEHHKIEGIFKAFARALKAAVVLDKWRGDVPSSKGSL